MNDQAMVKRVDVFVGGQGGYPVYRIPSIIATAGGNILAFAEGRQSMGDQSENDIVMRKSTDNGVSWDDVKVIASSGKESLNNPQVVQVRETKRIILFYQRYPYRSREHSIIPGFKDKR
nr:sialidase family protein [Candidatus Sigynarchaeota archaeon]